MNGPEVGCAVKAGRPRTFDVQQVVRQARDVFHDHGYGGTSIEDLSAASGLNRSSLYATFGDKHTLFMRCFADYCDEQATVIARDLGGEEEGAVQRLRDHFSSKTSDPFASRRGCLLAKVTAERAGVDAELASMATNFYADYLRALTECVACGQAAGDLRQDIPASDGAALLLGALRGIEALGRTEQPPQALQRIAQTALNCLCEPGDQTVLSRPCKTRPA
jgi:TetR/AcrR family transcriptional repressor of nem operon